MVKVGNTQDIIVTEEVVYGDGGNFATSKFKFGSAQKLTSPEFSRNWREINGGGLQSLRKVVGEKGFKFNYEFLYTQAQFLKFVLNTVSEVGTSPTTHTLNIIDTTQPGSIALQWSWDSGLAYNFVGVVITDVNFTWSKPSGEGDEAFIKVNLTCTAKDVTKAGSVEATVVDDLPFMFNNVLFTTASNELVEVNSGSYSLNPNADLDTFYCNFTLVNTRDKPIYQIFTHALNINYNVKDETRFDEFLTGVEVSGTNKIEFIRSATEKVSFNFSSFYSEGQTPPTEHRQVLKADGVWGAILQDVVVLDEIANY